MSKILLGNNKEKIDQLNKLFVACGFDKYSSHHNKSITSYFYKKLNVENTNYKQYDDDFIAIAGTIIYKNTVGEQALEKIYDDFAYGFNFIRDNAIGNYCVTVKKDEFLYIFTDKNAIYNIYYYNHSDWVVTNTFFHLAKVIDHTSINRLEMFEYSFQHAIIGNKTPYENIYKLLGDEYIKFNINDNQFLIEKFIYEDISILSTSIDDFAHKLVECSKVITDNFNKIAVIETPNKQWTFIGKSDIIREWMI